MNNHKKYEREREWKKKLHSPEWEERFVCVNEREMIKKKKKLHSPESFRGCCLLRLRKGVGGGVGKLEGARSSTSDDDEDDGNREGRGGDGSGNVLIFFFFFLCGIFVMNSARARRWVKFATLFKSFFFFFLIIFQGALNQIRVIQITLYRGRTVLSKLKILGLSYAWIC